MARNASSVYILDSDLAEDQHLQSLLKKLDIPVIFSPQGSNGEEIFTKDFVPPSERPLYVVRDFESEIAARMLDLSKPLMGLPALIGYLEAGETRLPWPFTDDNIFCPRFNRLLKGKNIGIQISKEKRMPLIKLIRWMSGSARQELQKIDLLISESVKGAKYSNAVAFGIPVLTVGWLYDVWSHRQDAHFDAFSKELLKSHALKPFTGLKIGLAGFSESDQLEIQKITEQNGGEVLPLDTHTIQLTHVVVDGAHGLTDVATSSEFISQIQCNINKINFVYSGWFWASVQLTIREDESKPEFKFPIAQQGSCKSPSVSSSYKAPLTPDMSQCHSHINALQTPTPTPAAHNGIQSPLQHYALNNNQANHDSTSNCSHHSLPPQSFISTAELRLSMDFDQTMNSSMMDASSHCDLDASHISGVSGIKPGPKSPDYDSWSVRRRVCVELLDTERNYINILKALVNVFKEPLESMLEKPDEQQLLDGTEIKIIFGNIPPLLTLHESIAKELEKLVEKKWKEHNRIGMIFINHAESFIKFYPPFVNFFEDTKKTLKMCEERDPRFHAFLKRCQSRIECQRQPLTELLIRPVQRLPSLQLLLSELLKKTPQDNPDHVHLGKALDSIKQALTLINDSKRKTEGQVVLFEIAAEIEDCPAYLISANRKYICRINARVATPNFEDGICKLEILRGSMLTLFIFSDSIEICKRKSVTRSNSLKNQISGGGQGSSHASAGPSGPGGVPTGGKPPHQTKGSKKSYRHLEFISFDYLKTVASIKVNIPDQASGSDTLKVIPNHAGDDTSPGSASSASPPLTSGTNGSAGSSQAPENNAIYFISISHNQEYNGYIFVIEDDTTSKEKFLNILTSQLGFNSINEITLDSIIYTNGSNDLMQALSKNSTIRSMNRARETISRAFSMRRATAAIAPAGSLNQLILPATPSKVTLRKSPGAISMGGAVPASGAGGGTPQSVGRIKKGSQMTRRISRIFSPFMPSNESNNMSHHPPIHRDKSAPPTSEPSSATDSGNGKKSLPSTPRLGLKAMSTMFGSTQSLFTLSETASERENILGPPTTPAPKKKKGPIL